MEWECGNWKIKCSVVGESHFAILPLKHYFCYHSFIQSAIKSVGNYSVDTILQPYCPLCLDAFVPRGLPICHFLHWNAPCLLLTWLAPYPWDLGSKVIPPSGNHWVTHRSFRFLWSLAPFLYLMTLSRICNYIFVLCPPPPILDIEILECRNHLFFSSM